MLTTMARLALTAAALSLLSATASAERADRFAGLVIDAKHSAMVDLVNHVYEFTGPVTISKGSLVIRAQRATVSETREGYYKAVAYGSEGAPATLSQRWDAPGESVLGSANRLEYDGKSDTLRLVGRASVKHLHGAAVAEQASGEVISYDNLNEIFSLDSAAGGARAASSPGVQIIIKPRTATANKTSN